MVAKSGVAAAAFGAGRVLPAEADADPDGFTNVLDNRCHPVCQTGWAGPLPFPFVPAVPDPA